MEKDYRTKWKKTPGLIWWPFRGRQLTNTGPTGCLRPLRRSASVCFSEVAFTRMWLLKPSCCTGISAHCDARKQWIRLLALLRVVPCNTHHCPENNCIDCQWGQGLCFAEGAWTQHLLCLWSQAHGLNGATVQSAVGRSTVRVSEFSDGNFTGQSVQNIFQCQAVSTQGQRTIEHLQLACHTWAACVYESVSRSCGVWVFTDCWERSPQDVWSIVHDRNDCGHKCDPGVAKETSLRRDTTAELAQPCYAIRCLLTGNLSLEARIQKVPNQSSRSRISAASNSSQGS